MEKRNSGSKYIQLIKNFSYIQGIIYDASQGITRKYVPKIGYHICKSIRFSILFFRLKPKTSIEKMFFQ